MIVTSSVWENLFYFGSLASRLAKTKQNIVLVVQKARTDILLSDLVCFEVSLPRSAHLKILLSNFRHFDDVVLNLRIHP